MAKPVFVRTVASFLFVTILCASAAAQPFFFGDPILLTKTRYAAPGRYQRTAGSRLVTNGQDFFLFWYADSTLRMTRLGEDNALRPGLPLGISGVYEFDVAWTGSQFLVAYHSLDDASHGRVIKTQPFGVDGQPLGKPAIVARNVKGPHLAFNGRVALLLFDNTDTAWALVLSAKGLAEGRSVVLVKTLSEGVAIASAGNGFSALTRDGHDSWITMFNDGGHVVSQQLLGPGPSDYEGAASIASNGSSYLVSQCVARVEVHGLEYHHFLTCKSYAMTPSGKVSVPLTIEDSRGQGVTNGLDAVWAGDSWVVAYVAWPKDQGYRARVVTLNPAADSEVSREETEGLYEPLLSAIGSRVKFAWQVAGSPNAITSADLPLARNVANIETCAGTRQRVLATASTNDATLVVWSEAEGTRGVLRAGIRKQTGEWIETEIGSQPDDSYPRTWNASAASDGQAFVIAFTTNFEEGSPPAAVSLDADARVGWSTPLPFFPQGMAWNGKIYGLIGGLYGDARLAALTPSGQVTRTGSIPHHLGAMVSRIASNGDGFLALIQSYTYFPGEIVDDAFAVRLNADLQPADEKLGPFEGYEPDVIWDGEEYLVTWVQYQTLVAARVPASGDMKPIEDVAWDVTFAAPPIRMGDGVAIAWIRAHPYSPSTVPSSVEVGLFPRGDWNGSVSVSQATNLHSLVSLHDGRIALLGQIMSDVPHYHVSRVQMTIGDLSPLSKPDSPVIRVQRQASGAVRIAWNAPSRRVTSYRLEYRTATTPWTELEDIIGGDQRSLVFRPRLPGQVDQFRMRAWSDGGASSYSNVAEPVAAPDRRRSVSK